MDLDTAPRIEDDAECPICGGEATYVRYENARVCEVCGHAPTSTNVGESDDWEEWWMHRKSSDEYSGWLGPSRIRMVGGFKYVYHEDD